MSAAVAAITSAVGVLDPYRVQLAIALIALVTLANLRGLKESGQIFAIPTYLFVLSMFTLIGVGLFKVIVGGGAVLPAPPPATPLVSEELQSISFFLLLRAFAAGCTALTGIEAIADGVPAFKKPESRNAAITLVILCTMFLGTTMLANAYHVIPDGSRAPETANSQLARVIFGSDSLFYDELDKHYEDDVLTVILLEFIPSKWWQHLLHNQTALLIKATLLFTKGRVVTSVPYHLEH